MELKKDGIVFKVAYGWTDKDKYPQRTTLCRLFWRFLFWLFIAWPFIVVVLVIFVTILYVIGFFFAARPAWLKDDPDDALMCHYRSWPKVKERKLFPIWPTSAIVLSAFYLLNAAELKKELSSFGHGMVKFTILSPIFWKVVLAFAVMVAVIWIWSAAAKTEPYRLFKAFLKAKKEKVCPIIRIVE